MCQLVSVLSSSKFSFSSKPSFDGSHIVKKTLFKNIAVTSNPLWPTFTVGNGSDPGCPGPSTLLSCSVLLSGPCVGVLWRQSRLSGTSGQGLNNAWRLQMIAWSHTDRSWPGHAQGHHFWGTRGLSSTQTLLMFVGLIWNDIVPFLSPGNSTSALVTLNCFIVEPDFFICKWLALYCNYTGGQPRHLLSSLFCRMAVVTKPCVWRIV